VKRPEVPVNRHEIGYHSSTISIAERLAQLRAEDKPVDIVHRNRPTLGTRIREVLHHTEALHGRRNIVETLFDV
jgi:hypothetical protein